MAGQHLEQILRFRRINPGRRQHCSEYHSLDEVATLGLSNGFKFSGIDVVRHQAEATL